MRFSLRTLVIVMLLAGPLGALGYKEWRAYRERRALEDAAAQAAMDRQLRIARINRQLRAIWSSRAGATTTTESPAEREYWQQLEAKISWESFPESLPPAP